MKIIECPRDAMQGLTEFIPTLNKIRYLNQLMKVGFDTIDFGSFVSVKSIPQLRDTTDVIKNLEIGNSKTKLLAIVANTRGALEACTYEAITHLGFPLSLSETFQQRNTNKSIKEALNILEEIKTICLKSNKKLVTYISMGFGNPYGDLYDVSMAHHFVDILKTVGSDIISVADTIGVATPESIRYLFTSLTSRYPELEIGAHLHSTPQTSMEKIDAAYQSGCQRFDVAIRGFGGCPMANDALTGNLATENILAYLENVGVKTSLNENELAEAMRIADEIFPKH